MKRLRQSGFVLLPLLLAVGVVVVGVMVYFATRPKSTHTPPTAGPAVTANTNYRPDTAPSQACTTPSRISTPVDLKQVTSILYPGQMRGNEYKAHGGFRFDGLKPQAVTVRAPLDAQLYRASRYTQSGDVQILFEFNAACGLTYRFDHILTAAPALQRLVDALPAPTSDSHTTQLSNPVDVKAGDVVAVAVGSPSTGNVFVDFGVYDTMHKNVAAGNPDWLAKHSSNLTDQYGLCWFGMLPPADEAIVRALPSASRESGKQSDYCK